MIKVHIALTLKGERVYHATADSFDEGRSFEEALHYAVQETLSEDDRLVLTALHYAGLWGKTRVEEVLHRLRGQITTPRLADVLRRLDSRGLIRAWRVHV